MLNKPSHTFLLNRILKEIYENMSVGPLLGFKGGTCAAMFYGLPRFSVDLDFDLLRPNKDSQSHIFKELTAMLQQYGDIHDSHTKKSTVFFELSQKKDTRKIKIEVSTRRVDYDLVKYYSLKNFLGISVLVASKEYLFTTKLVALTKRSKFTARDLFDVAYFAKENTAISDEVIKFWTQTTTSAYIKEVISFIEKLPNNKLLLGLGELIDDEQKKHIKTKIKKDAVFYLSSI